MLKNEFQSMIEQYSNELMNISRQSDEDIPANAEPVPPPSPQVVETAAQPENLSTENTESKEISVNAEPVEAQTPNLIQSSDLPKGENIAQPRDIPRKGESNTSMPAPVNVSKYSDESENMTYEQFLSENPGSGILRVQVFSGQQVTPIPNAEVVVSKEFLNGRRVFFSGLTDISGIVDGIELPAPSRELSESPQPRGDGVTLPLPYSQYNLTVNHVRYIPQEYTHVPVFDGIKSVQPVRMIPIQFSNGNNSTIVFEESEPNNL